MAKTRYINTKFWDDKYIANLPPYEKLLFLYLLTNPLTNIAGIYEIEVRRIFFDTGIEESIIQEILNNFEASKKIYYRKGWIVIANFIKNQSLNPKVKTGIREVLKTIPKDIKRLAKIDEDRIGIGDDSLSHSNSNSNLNSNSNPNPKVEPSLLRESRGTGGMKTVAKMLAGKGIKIKTK